MFNTFLCKVPTNFFLIGPLPRKNIFLGMSRETKQNKYSCEILNLSFVGKSYYIDISFQSDYGRILETGAELHHPGEPENCYPRRY